MKYEKLDCLNLSNLQQKLIIDWANSEGLTESEAILKLIKIGFKSVFDEEDN